jgi:hypothetical protein
VFRLLSAVKSQSMYRFPAIYVAMEIQPVNIRSFK